MRASMNWPNGLTLGRLILGPIVFGCLMAGQVGLAFSLFVLAMATDLYDGYLARRSNTVTEFGRILDPLADKVLVCLALVGFVFMSLPYVPLWMVAVIIGRELLILGCRTGAIRSGEGFVTSKIAKWKTAAQMAWVASILLYLTVLSAAGVSVRVPIGGRAETFLVAFGLAAVVLTLVSGAEYLLSGRSFARSRGAVAGAGRGERG
jgi:CDP-diacylglycerol--glycerol-3-phosphate 3-phosphatidyltransferase